MDKLEYSVAEFASRWRRELYLNQVKAGEELSKNIKAGYITGRTKKETIDNLRSEAEKARSTQKIEPKWERYDSLEKKKNNIGTDQTTGKRRISSYGKERLTELRNKTPSKVTKIKGLGKLGIRAAGLLAGGALAYGLARKLRSDKGKKRRFYNR